MGIWQIIIFAAQNNLTVMIIREITKNVTEDYDKGKIIVVKGPRQVGKTTFLEQLIDQRKNVLRFNGDDYDDAEKLTHRTSTELRQMISGCDMVVIDEAQRIPDIGLTLKILADLKMDIQIIVTGSSSLDLANKINEPATGRLYEHFLFPLSTREMVGFSDQRAEKRLLETRMIYGFYPEVVTKPREAKRLLSNITNSYLYRDLLGYKGVKKPLVLQKLVKALALQIGSEVSYNELANLIGIDRGTVENYIYLLEQCYVIFHLDSYANNQRNEIKKGKKVYFYDIGVRNALINNYSPMSLRQDVGAIWENFAIVERMKKLSNEQRYVNFYFWRSLTQQEVDLVEEEDGQIRSYEFKWNAAKRAKQPSGFAEKYPDTPFEVITPENYMSFVL